jgi:ribonuclease Z
MRVSRWIVALFGLLFAALGLGFWIRPELAAGRLHLAAVGLEGLSTLRADLGGLFIGLAVLCLASAWTRRRDLALAAALVLGAIALGRLIGVAAAGWTTAVAAPLTIELSALTAVGVYARGLEMSAERSRRGWIALAVLVLIVGAAAIAVQNGRLQQALFARAAEQVIRSDNAALLNDDALRVAVCGSSAPLPSPQRAKACVAVIAGGKYYLVDVGPESVENLMLWGLPLDRIGGVLLTHFHSDHIGDLGELNLQTWAQGRPAPLAVYGGSGVEQVVAGFNQAYGLDQGYRTAHHTAKMMPAQTWPMIARPVPLPEPATAAKDRTAVVLEQGGLRITAIEVNHAPVAPAYAYRFDYKGRSVVVSGDMSAHPPLVQASEGADLLMSEAIARDMIRTMGATAREAGRPRVAAIMHDIQSYHISPQEAADIANRAKVQLLVFYHLLPAPDNPLTRRVFAQGVREVRQGDWTLADDGSLYTLPIGSDEIRIGRITR